MKNIETNPTFEAHCTSLSIDNGHTVKDKRGGNLNQTLLAVYFSCPATKARDIHTYLHHISLSCLFLPSGSTASMVLCTESFSVLMDACNDHGGCDPIFFSLFQSKTFQDASLWSSFESFELKLQ